MYDEETQSQESIDFIKTLIYQQLENDASFSSITDNQLNMHYHDNNENNPMEVCNSQDFDDTNMCSWRHKMNNHITLTCPITDQLKYAIEELTQTKINLSKANENIKKLKQELDIAHKDMDKLMDFIGIPINFRC